MSNYQAIPVRDGKGDELIVYVYRGRRQSKLCTGELVVRVNDALFAIAATGERLECLEPPVS